MKVVETSTGTDAADLEEVINGLNELLRLDHDAIGSYEIAIERLENPEHAVTIQGFLRDHQAHIRRLNEIITELGGSPTNEPHATGPLKQALQAFGETAGDHGLLMTWRANELQVMTKYDRYAREAVGWPVRAKHVVDENALDEERHYAWVVDALGVDDPTEVHLVNRFREFLESRGAAGPSQLLAAEIREHPARVLMIAFAVGLLAGRLIR